MKFLANQNTYLQHFLVLLSDDTLDFIERSLNKFEIVNSVFSIEINSYVSIHFAIKNGVAYVASFNYGRYSNLNFGRTQKEIEFIKILQHKHYDCNNLIELSPKNKLKLEKMKRLH